MSERDLVTGPDGEVEPHFLIPSGPQWLDIRCLLLYLNVSSHSFFSQNQMKNPLRRAFRKLSFRSQKERRLHLRHSSIVRVDYLVLGSWYRGSIRNISEGGLYIRSSEEGDFSKGVPILMVVEFGVLRHQIRGKIIRVGSAGFAVAFHNSEPAYSELKALLATHCLIR